MKRDTAERLAATAVEDVTVEQARTIIDTFLTQLSRCPACDGSGRLRFARDVHVDMLDEHDQPMTGPQRYIRAGTIGSCPLCGSQDREAEGHGDPEWVAWHCFRGDDERDCRLRKSRTDERATGHESCGWRLMLPLPSEAGS